MCAQVEEADLELSKDLFGGDAEAEANAEGAPKVILIEAMDPTSGEDFTVFGAAIAKKATKYSESAHYQGFLENLCKALVENVKA